jgi:carboxymethylenebutenolidase
VTNNKDMKAAFSFYGPMPEKEEDLARIPCPVYGFYGGNDARINASIPRATEQMKKAGKTYDPVTYEGAGHGFMRAGEDPADKNPANKKARDEAWERWKGLLKKI